MALTPQHVLRGYILLALHERGGSALKREVIAWIEERFGDDLTADDHRPQPSNGEVKWENQVAWERNSMVTDQLIERYIPGETTRGRWSLTGLGRREASRLAEQQRG